MPKRVKLEELHLAVARLNGVLRACDHTLDGAAGNKRLLRDGRPISPRLPARALSQWMEGYEEGVRAARQRHQSATCRLCGKEVPMLTAHRHQYGWVGDACCWDERLRSTE